MKNKKLFNAIVKISLLSMVLAMSFQVLPTNAAPLTALKDTMTRLQISQAASHVIAFTTATAVTAAQTIEIRFDPTTNLFVLATLVGGDISVTGMTLVANVGACAGAADEVYPTIVDAGPADTVTFTVCAGDTVPAGIKTVTLANAHVVNPGVVASYAITIGGTMADSGTIIVPIIDSDQVTITATIDPTLTFDLDTAAADGETVAPYSVALGTLTTGAVATSGVGGANYIFVDLATNATGGAVVTALDVGSGVAAGLYSATVAKNIASGTVTVTAGTEGYGVCVSADGDTNLTAVPPYNTAANCTTIVHDVGALSLAAAAILNTAGAPVTGGKAKIFVKAAISSTTPAAVDYTDKLTFIATGTF